MFLSNFTQLLLAVAVISFLYLLAKRPQAFRPFVGIVSAAVFASVIYVIFNGHNLIVSGARLIASLH